MTETPALPAPLSILILNWRDPKHPSAGGAEAYLFEMARRWVARGHRVQWLAAGFAGCAPSETLDGVRVARVGTALTVYAAIPIEYGLHYRNGFDVIVDAENGIPFFSPLFSTVPKLCLIFHVHKRVFESNLPWPLSSLFVWLESSVMPRVYRDVEFVTISQTSHDEMLEHGFSDRPVAIVEPGVSAACKPSAKSASPLLSYVGRLKAYKRVDLLLRAFATVRAAVPDARLVVVGTGDRERALRSLASELALDDGVTFTGFVDEATKVRIQGESWLSVSPSSMEGWGIVAIEANACGTPFLCFDVPGLRVAVDDGTSGVIVPEGSDPAPAMIRILTDGALRRRLEEGALRHARAFSWDATAAAFLDLMLRVAGRAA